MAKMAKDKTKKKGKVRRFIKYFFIAAAALLIWDIAPAFFYSPLDNPNPMPAFYKKGVYHMHSVFSDGKGTIGEITRHAAETGMDFAILTDHGRPNVKSALSTSRLNNVLLIGGSELSLNSGHLACIGFQNPPYIFPPEPQESINEIMENPNGVTFISHPFDNKIPWTDWDISGYTGIEVLSSYSEARKSGILKILVFPLKYLINSRYALLETMSYPEKNFDMWDAVNARNYAGRYYGIYALDAHAKLPITKTINLNFPTYKSMFQVMTVYVNITPPFPNEPGQQSTAVLSALRSGRFFNAIEAIAPANGFHARFITDNTGTEVPMGQYTPATSGTIILDLPFEFPTDVHIIHNGEPFKQIQNNTKKKLEIHVTAPGIYRAEIFAPDSTFDELPWLVTNPFFVATSPKATVLNPSVAVPTENAAILPVKRHIISPGQPFPLKIEKNKATTASLEEIKEELKKKIADATTEPQPPFHRFQFHLKKDSPTTKDFWAALALRKPMDISAFQGITLEARSITKQRFWLELRNTTDTLYRHSFQTGPQWRTIHIPLKNLYPYHGPKRPINLKTIQSLFITINNACAYPNTKNIIDIKNMGLY